MIQAIPRSCRSRGRRTRKTMMLNREEEVEYKRRQRKERARRKVRTRARRNSSRCTASSNMHDNLSTVPGGRSYYVLAQELGKRSDRFFFRRLPRKEGSRGEQSIRWFDGFLEGPVELFTDGRRKRRADESLRSQRERDHASSDGEREDSNSIGELEVRLQILSVRSSGSDSISSSRPRQCLCLSWGRITI